MPVKVDLTEEQIEDGKAMLKKLLVAGRETATGFGQYTDLLTPIIAPQHPNASVKNLRSVVFHRTETGWFVLFVLKKVSKGLPAVFGTPADRPCKTLDEAYLKACITVGHLYNAKRLGIRPGSKRTSKVPDAFREMIFTTY
jgi:hypothetical protein